MTPILTDDEQDLVTELMNLGVGHAAGAFSRLVNDEVLLSVPDVEFASIEEAVGYFDAFSAEVLAGVMQTFDGFINGTASLLFPGGRSLELVRAVIGEDLPDEEISELEQETLAEIGNIILNHCLATMANALKKEIHTSLPETYAGSGRTIVPLLAARSTPKGEGGTSSLMMLVRIDFALRSRNLEGYLAFVIDLDSATSFHEALRGYLAKLEEG